MDAAELTGAIAAEKRPLDPSMRRDPGAVSELLDDDFAEIGQSGTVWTRALAHQATRRRVSSL